MVQWKLIPISPNSNSRSTSPILVTEEKKVAASLMPEAPKSKIGPHPPYAEM